MGLEDCLKVTCGLDIKKRGRAVERILGSPSKQPSSEGERLKTKEIKIYTDNRIE